MAHDAHPRHGTVRSARQGTEGLRTILITAAGFAVVAGVLAFAVQQAPSSPAQPAAPVASVEQPAADVAPIKPAQVGDPVAVAEVPAKPQPAAASVAVAKPNDSASRARLLAEQAAAGEFGPAMATANAATDPVERTALLNQIADAQSRSGEFRAADAVIRRMPIPEKRDVAKAENQARRSAAGGGADASALLELIQNLTGEEGDWEEERRDPQFWEPGVRVDPNGLLRTLTKTEQTARLDSLHAKARTADLNTDVAAHSGFRVVSLTRLEKEIAKRLAEGRSIPKTMQHLAGLSQIRYLLVDAENNDIMIGGPAEGWRYNAEGLAVGANSGRPTLYLDDLVTVLRTFGPRGEGFFNCLIVPREDGLKAIKQFVAESNARGPLPAGGVGTFAAQLQKKLGLQDVEINGVPLDSRVAQVIVEADYRMKLIGVGKLNGGVEIPSYFDLLPKTGEVKSQKMDALRWWLSMKYDSVMHSPDRNAFEIQGSAVLCQSENELITAQGQRIHTGQADATNRLFASNFTKHYATLAARDLVFADLQNVFDLALVAALIGDNRMADRVSWNMGAFASNGGYHTTKYAPPKTVMSVVNHRVYNGKDVVVQVAGGVDGKIRKVLKDEKVVREVPRLAGAETRARATQLPEGRWWWDAK